MKTLDPKTLAEQLDDVLPANSGIILDGGEEDTSIIIAKMLAEYSTEQLDERSFDLIEEHTMLDLDRTLAENERRRKWRPLMLLLSVILIAGCAAIFMIPAISQPIISSFFGGEETEITEEVVIIEEATEEVIATATGIEETVPTETIEPTEIIPTETQVIEPTATVVIPTEIPLQEAAFVQTTAVNVRAESNANSTILTTLAQNAEVTIIGFNADESWSQVELDNGTIGWIASNLLDDTPVPVAAPANNNGGNNNPPPGGNGNGGNGGRGNGNGNGNGGRGGRGGNGGGNGGGGGN